MPRGVTQEQVSDAAEALLRQGERPTIEKVRAHLGTGSPNTLMRLLDAWWKALGERLDAIDQKVSLPDAPDAVNDLASKLWLKALEEAAQVQEQALEEQREQLRQGQAQLQERLIAVERTVDEAQAAAREAAESERAVHARFEELEKRAEQQSALIEDLTAQRDALAVDKDSLTEANKSLQVDLRKHIEQAAAERKEGLSKQAADQKYWLLELDRARQTLAQRDKELKEIQKASDQAARDAKRLATGLSQDLKARDRELASLRGKLTKLQSKMTKPKPAKARQTAARVPPKKGFR